MLNTIMECVPNFSEGRDLAKVEKIVDAFRGKEGVKLLLSELDRGRREYLLKHIKGKQVIMTTCEKEGFEADHLIVVKNGTYQRME